MICWEDKELEWIKDEPLKARIRSKRSSIYQAYLRIQEFLRDSHEREVTV